MLWAFFEIDLGLVYNIIYVYYHVSLCKKTVELLRKTKNRLLKYVFHMRI